MEDVKGAPGKGGKKANPEHEKFFAPYNRCKEEGKDFHKRGKYDEAMDKYKSCLKTLETLQKSNKIGVPSEEFLKREATTNNNIAVCYKQKQEASGVIIYATKVINSPITDREIKLKAYILRAYAHEDVDKIKLAREDWIKVKEMQPGNIDASKALTRIEVAITKDNAQRVSDTLGEALKSLDDFKKRGNDLFKASKLMFFSFFRGL